MSATIPGDPGTPDPGFLRRLEAELGELEDREPALAEARRRLHALAAEPR